MAYSIQKLMSLKKWDGFTAGSCDVLSHYSKEVYYGPQWTFNFNDKRLKDTSRGTGRGGESFSVHY